MSRAPANRVDDIPEAVRRCGKLGRQLAAGVVTFEEYAYSTMLAMAAAEDAEIATCVGSIPPAVLAAYKEYVREHLEPVDFMPSPMPFLAGSYTDEQAAAARRRLRPRYQLIHRLVTAAQATG